MVRPEDCVARAASGGTVLILDCPTLRHAAALAGSALGKLAGDAALAPPLILVHLAPAAVLASELYRAFAASLPSSASAVSHIVVDQSIPPSRPLYVASERYLFLSLLLSSLELSHTQVYEP